MRYQDASKEDLRKRLSHRYRPGTEDIVPYEDEEIVDLIFGGTTDPLVAQMLATDSGYITPTRRRK